MQIGRRAALALQPALDQSSDGARSHASLGENRNGRQVNSAQGAIHVLDARERETALGRQTRFGGIKPETHRRVQRQADGVLSTFKIAQERGVKGGRIGAIGSLANGPALGALAERIAAAHVGR